VNDIGSRKPIALGDRRCHFGNSSADDPRHHLEWGVPFWHLHQRLGGGGWSGR